MIIREQGNFLSLSLFKMTFTVSVSDKLTSNVWKWSLKTSFWVRLCYPHLFFFFFFWYLDALTSGPLLSWKTLLFPRSAIAKTAGSLQVCFANKKNNPSRVPTPATSLSQLSHSGPLSTCPHQPRARCRTTWDSLFVPSPVKSVELMDPVWLLFLDTFFPGKPK